MFYLLRHWFLIEEVLSFFGVKFVLFAFRHQRLEDNGEEGGGGHPAVSHFTCLSMWRNPVRKVVIHVTNLVCNLSCTIYTWWFIFFRLLFWSRRPNIAHQLKKFRVRKPCKYMITCMYKQDDFHYINIVCAC